MSENNEEKKDIEVVEGIGNLDISPVYDHLAGSKPKMQDEKPKNIVIPPVKKPTKEENNIVSDEILIDEDKENIDDFDLIDDITIEDIDNEDSDDDSNLTDDIDDIEIEFDDLDIDSDLTDDIDEDN